MIEVTYGGRRLDVDVIELDTTMPDDPQPLKDALQVNQELTLNVYYYQLLWLASKVEQHNPKKARRIRRLAELHNPLRLIGLL